MNILYLAHRIPYPPNKGEKIRAFHQIRELAKHHAVHVCAFVDDPADLAFVPEFRKHCASVEIVFRKGSLAPVRAAVGFLLRHPLSVSLFYHRSFALQVEQKLAAKQFDCIMCSSSSMAQYASLANGLPKVIDFIDVDSEKWRVYGGYHGFPMSLIYRLEGRRLANYEKTITEAFDLSILSSNAEKHVLQDRVPDGSISVVSNGVDLEYFNSAEINESQTSSPTIIFVGVMDYFPNVDAVRYFCHEIFPFVRDEVVEAQFLIVGRNPIGAVRKLVTESNVFVTGAVADVRPYLARASVSVAPFRIARGVQNKVLESMAMGVPVVGTAESFKGIAATEEDGIHIAKDPYAFAQQVIMFLQADGALRRRAGQQARRYVERHHRWEDQGVQLEKLLEKVVSGWEKRKQGIHRRGAEDTELANFSTKVT